MGTALCCYQRGEVLLRLYRGAVVLATCFVPQAWAEATCGELVGWQARCHVVICGLGSISNLISFVTCIAARCNAAYAVSLLLLCQVWVSQPPVVNVRIC